MKTYEVVIRYRVTKTYSVEAETPDAAREWAYSNGSTVEDGADEDYDEEVLRVEELK